MPAILTDPFQALSDEIHISRRAFFQNPMAAFHSPAAEPPIEFPRVTLDILFPRVNAGKKVGGFQPRESGRTMLDYQIFRHLFIPPWFRFQLALANLHIKNKHPVSDVVNRSVTLC